MFHRLPNTSAHALDRRYGRMVFPTKHITTVTDLARRILDDLHAEYGSTTLVGRGRRPFGANAWVYRGRFIDFEIFGMFDSELDDKTFRQDVRREFEEFVDQYDWSRPENPSDHRFHGRRVFLCREAEQDYRGRAGQVWTYRAWRRLASRRFRPFLPIETR